MYYVCDDSSFTPCDFKSGVKTYTLKITLGSFQGEDGSCPSSLKASGAIAWLHPYLDYKIHSTMQFNYQIHGLQVAGEYKNKRLFFFIKFFVPLIFLDCIYNLLGKSSVPYHLNQINILDIYPLIS